MLTILRWLRAAFDKMAGSSGTPSTMSPRVTRSMKRKAESEAPEDAPSPKRKRKRVRFGK